MKKLLSKLGPVMVGGAVIISGGAIIIAMLKGYEIEVKSPFFGDWKLKHK